MVVAQTAIGTTPILVAVCDVSTILYTKECATNCAALLTRGKQTNNHNGDNDADDDNKLCLSRRQALKMAQHHRGIADVLEEVAFQQ